MTGTWDRAPDRQVVVGQGMKTGHKTGSVFRQGGRVGRAVVVGCCGTGGGRDACRRRLSQHTDRKQN